MSNGWYKIVTKVGPLSEKSGGRPKPSSSNWSPTNWNHGSCAVEGSALTSSFRNSDDSTYTNWVEVVDGRITFEDAGAWYVNGLCSMNPPCTAHRVCWTVYVTVLLMTVSFFPSSQVQLLLHLPVRQH